MDVLLGSCGGVAVVTITRRIEFPHSPNAAAESEKESRKFEGYLEYALLFVDPNPQF